MTPFSVQVALPLKPARNNGLPLLIALMRIYPFAPWPDSKSVSARAHVSPPAAARAMARITIPSGSTSLADNKSLQTSNSMATDPFLKMPNANSIVRTNLTCLYGHTVVNIAL